MVTGQSGSLPALKDSAVTKLKQLTLVSLAAQSRILPYGSPSDLASVN
jgi:hypothetical protein